MSSIKTTQIDGDVSIGRNVAIGGGTIIQGDAHIKGGVKVDGWLEAKNIKATNKGLFTTVEKLRAAYPLPHEGWWAIVGNTLPGSVYVVDGGKWTPTGEMGGSPTIESERYASSIAELEASMTTAKADISGHTEKIKTIEKQSSEQGVTINQTNETAVQAKELVSTLEERLTALIGNNATTAIDNFNEVIKFLAGVKDNDTLTALLAKLNERLTALEHDNNSAEAIQNVKQLVERLQEQLNTIVGEGATNAIENFNEIKNFLAGLQDSDTLTALLAKVNERLTTLERAKSSTDVREVLEFDGFTDRAVTPQMESATGDFKVLFDATNKRFVAKINGENHYSAGWIFEGEATSTDSDYQTRGSKPRPFAKKIYINRANNTLYWWNGEELIQVKEELKGIEDTRNTLKAPYVSEDTTDGIFELVSYAKKGDKFKYSGTVDAGKFGITQFENSDLTNVIATFCAGKGVEKINEEGVFEKDGFVLIYNRNLIRGFGKIELFGGVEKPNPATTETYSLEVTGNWITKELNVKKGDVIKIRASGDPSKKLLTIISDENSSDVFSLPFAKTGRPYSIQIASPFDGQLKASNRNFSKGFNSISLTSEDSYISESKTMRERLRFQFPETSLPWDSKTFKVSKGDVVEGFLYGDKSHNDAIQIVSKKGISKTLLKFDGVFNDIKKEFKLTIREDGEITIQNRSFGRHLGEITISSPLMGFLEGLKNDFESLQNKVKASTSYEFNVKEFGAKGDGVTDDTMAIQRAIDACFENGGGVVFIPNGNYKLATIQTKTDGEFQKKGHLFIPVCDNLENRVSIKLRGESAVQYTTFYVDARMGTSASGNKGATLFSTFLPDDLSTPLDNPISVITSIGWKNGGIPQNPTILKLESFNICTKCSDLGYPFVSGVDGSLIAQVDIRDLDVRTDGLTKNLKKSPAGHVCFGIMIGASLDDPHQSLDYVNISQGFNHGIISGLHVTGRCIDIQTCVNAFTFSKGGHFSEFSLVTIHHCTHNISSLDKEFDNVKIGDSRVLFSCFNYETQIGASPADFSYSGAVVDPQNHLYGQVRYFLGYSQGAYGEWTKTGGNNLKCESL